MGVLAGLRPSRIEEGGPCPILLAARTTLAVAVALAHAPAHKHHHHAHARRTHAGDVRWGRRHHWHPKPSPTGYVVEGRVSTFGWLTGDSEGQTADGGNTRRPCIAIRDDAKLDHLFVVTVLGHQAKMIVCDWGPAAWTGRSIDVTGEGDLALGFSPTSFPTGAWGVARELR